MVPHLLRSSHPSAFAAALTFTLVLAVSFGSTRGEAAEPAHLKVELLAEPAAVEPGKTFTVGLKLDLETHWHVYWKNPGDAGLPVTLDWTLPAGWSAGPIQWPLPERISVDPLMDYGYEGEVLFPVEITVPASAKPGVPVELKAKSRWLVCKEICLPGKADLSLTLPVVATGALPPADPARAELFRLARERLPVPASTVAAAWTFSVTATDSLYTVFALPAKPFTGTHPGFAFFPEEAERIENAAAQDFYPAGKGFALDLVRIPPEADEPASGPDTLRGLLVSTRGWDAAEGRLGVDLVLPVTLGEAPKATGPVTSLGLPDKDGHGGPATVVAFQDGPGPGAPGATEGTIGAAATAKTETAGFLKLLIMLGSAFLGGIILNLMPCVLPVLSLKIFDFVKRSGESRLKVFMHGVVFTLGVLLSFWVLAGLLLILRQGGQQLGWGYQLQSPAFLMVLCALFFFFSLNLFGVFEMGYIFTRIGSTKEKSGHMGSFMAGVTATVVATPCTGPFMSTAMGFAFTQPAYYSMLIFTFLGLGMASPYLLLAAFPAMMRYLPKPGEWMEHLKQFMGFPLLATAIWLAWVLGQQAGVDGLIALLVLLLMAGISAWILGKWTALHRSTPTRVIAGILALVIFLPSFVLVMMFMDQQRKITSETRKDTLAGRAASATSSASADKIAWEAFTPERLQALLAQGKPVFLDFTADWCLSCKVNEKVALDRPEVAAKFHELGIAALKADWTSRDEAIAKTLAGYGRNSIPLYVLYSGKGGEYTILPEIITSAIVLDALAKLPAAPGTALAP